MKSASLSQLCIFYEKFVWTGSGKNILQCTVILQNTARGCLASSIAASFQPVRTIMACFYILTTLDWLHTFCVLKL